MVLVYLNTIEIYEKENFRRTDKASRILDCYRDILVPGDGILYEEQLPNL
jgi:hypothetical protein